MHSAAELSIPTVKTGIQIHWWTQSWMTLRGNALTLQGFGRPMENSALAW